MTENFKEWISSKIYPENKTNSRAILKHINLTTKLCLTNIILSQSYQWSPQLRVILLVAYKQQVFEEAGVWVCVLQACIFSLHFRSQTPPIFHVKIKWKEQSLDRELSQTKASRLKTGGERERSLFWVGYRVGRSNLKTHMPSFLLPSIYHFRQWEQIPTLAFI